LSVNYGTLYPALLKLKQEDNHRKAKYYKLTRASARQLEKAARDREQTTTILVPVPRGGTRLNRRSAFLGQNRRASGACRRPQAAVERGERQTQPVLER
jgi:DNA-binding PadR family transcriptional regulator